MVFSRHCVRLTVSGCAPRRKLPQDEAEGVHVDTQEGVPLEVDGTFQDFGSHVAPRSHLRVKKKGERIKRSEREKSQAQAARKRKVMTQLADGLRR